MISRSAIEELRDRWQTTEANVAREFVQHVLLSSLYRGQARPARLAFKGGTALRLLAGSPRFSEDLDFTGWGAAFHVGRALEEAAVETGKAGVPVAIEESAATSGGWFASMSTRVHDWPVRVEWNVSLRAGAAVRTSPVLVASPLWPAYSVAALPMEALVTEKVEALLSRAKPRDFYDLYFILRKPLGDRRRLASKRTAILGKLARVEAKALYQELRVFLPRGHWPALKDLPRALDEELGRL